MEEVLMLHSMTNRGAGEGWSQNVGEFNKHFV